jgi:hydrogenase maturation factor
LIAVSESDVNDLLRDLKNEGYENSEVIAKVVQKDKKPLLVY